MTTLDEFMAINPNSYMAVVDTWRPQTTQFKEAFDDYKRWAGAPAGTEWTGRTGNAAYEAAATDCHGSDNTDDAAGDIVTLATATITYEVLPNLTGGQNLVERVLAQKDRVSIDQSFNMDYHPAEGESDESIARNREHVKESERLIKEYVGKWEKGCQTLKGQAEAAAQKITGCINPKTALVDGRKVLRDAAPRTTDPNATTVNYKEMYPKTVAAATDPAAIDPKVAALVPGLDPNATKAAGALAPGSLPELLDAASKAKPPIDPKVGSLTDNLLRIDPTMAARQSHVEKIPGRALDPNSPAGKATVDGLRGLYQSQGLPPAQVEAKVQEALKAGGQDQYAVKFADPNAPSATPSEHVSRDFGEQFNKFTNGISDAATRTIDGQIEQGKILTGQAGPGAPGVAEAWREVGINAAHQVHELTTDPLAAPKMGIEQAKDFINSPSEFIGKNIIHGTEALATGGIGGEAAAGARGLLGDLTGTEGRALTHGIEDAAPGHHSTPVTDHQAGGHDSPSHPTGHLPPEGEPGSFGYDADGNRLRYANGRPDYGPGQIPDVWNTSREDQLSRIGAGRLDLAEPGPGQQWVELHPRGPVDEGWTVENGHRLIDWQPGEPQKGLWDMGHVDGREYRTLREAYLSGQMTFEEYMAEYRNPDNYTVQDWYRNRSHIDEGP